MKSQSNWDALFDGSDAHELPPCVGEAMRDVLAERAIATLADWDDDDGHP